MVGMMMAGSSILVACKDGDIPADGAARSTEVSNAAAEPFPADQGLARWPYESLTDWVSYADAAVLVTVTGQDEIEASNEELEHGGLIGRTMTVAVNQVVWQHPRAPEPPAEFSFVDYGWIIRDGERRRFDEQGTVRLEVGDEYLVLIARLQGEGWFPVHPATALSVTSGRTDSTPPEGAVPGVEALTGLDLASVQLVLASTPPDPVAEANRHLNIEARWHLVRGDDQPPTPSSQPPADSSQPPVTTG